MNNNAIKTLEPREASFDFSGEIVYQDRDAEDQESEDNNETE